MIIRAKDADWSGKGFPLLTGFVAMDNLEAGFDLRPRTNRLQEVSGKGYVGRAYRNQLNNAELQPDNTVLENTANGLGLIVRNGSLDWGIPNKPLIVGGTDAFTMMVVGGYSGMPFDAGQPANNAIICNLADMGNGAAGTLRPVMLQQHNAGTLGGRIESNYASNLGSAESLGRKSCFFLSYDGKKFTYTNKTTGAIVTKTNAELGLANGTLPISSRAPHLVSGNYYVGTTAIIGLYPELYQLARWNRVLTDQEMQNQYASSKVLFSKVGI